MGMSARLASGRRHCRHPGGRSGAFRLHRRPDLPERTRRPGEHLLDDLGSASARSPRRRIRSSISRAPFGAARNSSRPGLVEAAAVACSREANRLGRVSRRDAARVCAKSGRQQERSNYVSRWQSECQRPPFAKSSRRPYREGAQDRAGWPMRTSAVPERPAARIPSTAEGAEGRSRESPKRTRRAAARRRRRIKNSGSKWYWPF